MDGFDAARLRALPQVQRLLDTPQAHELMERFPRAAVVVAVRGVLDDTRAALRQHDAHPVALDPATLLDRARALLNESQTPRLRRVINATGIILHTNIGRAPLAPEAAKAVAEASHGYCNLEFNLDQGERGSRTQGVEPLLRQLTGAEAALAVNNNAAAVLLALSALANGREVVVSRGELVEIGGGFRVPDVIQQGGARLIEVGTTNKTRLADYRNAITPSTSVLLKVHQSNFRMTGFTEETSLSELAMLARERNLLLVHDLGSGTVVDLRSLNQPAEPTVQESIAAGVDVVAFSGDKLLGGPQSGLLAGRATAIEAMRGHPLLRALRLGKLSLAALEATLRLHCNGAHDAVPALRKMGQALPVLRARAERLARLLGPFAEIEATIGYAGGGTLPSAGIDSIGVSLHLAEPTPERLKALLRGSRIPVVGRIANGRVLLDMLTVDDDELPDVVRAVRQAMPA